MKKKQRRKGLSYKKRIADVLKIYQSYARSGLSNREIWRRYIYPRFGISERTLYNLFNASAYEKNTIEDEQLSLFDLNDYQK